MLEGTPTVLNLFRKDGMWDVMFSEFFFYYGFGGLNLPSLKESKRSTKKGTTAQVTWAALKTSALDVNMVADHMSSSTFPSSILAYGADEALSLEVISFVELAATASGVSNNLVIPFLVGYSLSRRSFHRRAATLQ
jgi:hypothetical protein